MGDLLSSVTESGAFRNASLAVGVIGALVAVGVLVWLYRDADDRDAKPIVWMGAGTVAALVGALLGYTVQGAVGFMAVGLLMLAGVGIATAVYRVVRPVDLAEDALERDLSMHLLRVELEAKSCPRCSHAVESDFLLCPNCGLELRRPCGYCGRPVKSAWAACPYCGTRKGA